MESPMNTLPKWQSIMLNNNNIHGDDHKLIFGFTPPTVALVALAIFLCILLEIMFSTRKSSSSSSTSSSTTSSSSDPVLQVDRNSITAALVDRKQTVLLMIKYWSTSSTTRTEPAAAGLPPVKVKVKVKVADVSNCKKKQKCYWAFLMSDQGILLGFQEMICSFVLKAGSFGF